MLRLQCRNSRWTESSAFTVMHRERFELLFRDDGDRRVERRTERMLRDIEQEEEEGMADEIPELQDSDEEKESEKGNDSDADDEEEEGVQDMAKICKT